MSEISRVGCVFCAISAWAAVELYFYCNIPCEHEPSRGCCPVPNLQLQSLCALYDKMNHYHCSMKEHNLACSQLSPNGFWFVIASIDILRIQSTMQLSAFRPPRWKAWRIQEINRDKLITALPRGILHGQSYYRNTKLHGRPYTVNDIWASICTTTNGVQGRSRRCLWHVMVVCCTSDIKKHPPVWCREAAASARDISEAFRLLGYCSQSSKKYHFARAVCLSLTGGNSYKFIMWKQLRWKVSKMKTGEEGAETIRHNSRALIATVHTPSAWPGC